ncbi:MAG: nicotinamide-nucleotide amidohydrolase family protein [Candidatus Krumholzibacteriia bacterium]
MAEVWQIAIGDELLGGRTADTNSLRVQRALGTPASGILVVPDRYDAIVAALARTPPGSLVFLTGGLGSTPDDMTREALAGWAGAPLEERPELRAELERRARARGLSRFVGVSHQAQVPRGLTALPNPVGSAPALVGRLRGRDLVLLPGVQAEMEALLPAALDWLRARGVLPPPAPRRLWRTAQLAELAVVRICAPVRERYPHLDWSWWLDRWGVDVRLAVPPGFATAEEGGGEASGPLRDLEAAAAELDAALAPVTYARAPVSLAQSVQDLMLARDVTLAVAESCTAGLLAAALTESAGSSGYFLGGVVTYANDVKRDQLGVPEPMLAHHGAVSEPVARAMAAGVRERFGADYALSVTGVAGPGGGTEAKPVGTTWIAIATGEAVFARRFRFPADRTRNRAVAVATALDTLRRVLSGDETGAPWRSEDSWGWDP